LVARRPFDHLVAHAAVHHLVPLAAIDHLVPHPAVHDYVTDEPFHHLVTSRPVDHLVPLAALDDLVALQAFHHLVASWQCPARLASGRHALAAKNQGLHAGMPILAKCRDGVTRPPRRPTGLRGPRCSTRSSHLLDRKWTGERVDDRAASPKH
jgi:hypothetical protein